MSKEPFHYIPAPDIAFTFAGTLFLLSTFLKYSSILSICPYRYSLIPLIWYSPKRDLKEAIKLSKLILKGGRIMNERIVKGKVIKLLYKFDYSIQIC